MHCNHVDWFYECEKMHYRWPSKCGFDSKEELEKYASKGRPLNDVRAM